MTKKDVLVVVTIPGQEAIRICIPCDVTDWRTPKACRDLVDAIGIGLTVVMSGLCVPLVEAHSP